jgi:hypothetical protein
LIETLAQQTEVDMEKFACSEAIQCMLAYYEVVHLFPHVYYFSELTYHHFV